MLSTLQSSISKLQKIAKTEKQKKRIWRISHQFLENNSLPGHSASQQSQQPTWLQFSSSSQSFQRLQQLCLSHMHFLTLQADQQQTQTPCCLCRGSLKSPLQGRLRYKGGKLVNPGSSHNWGRCCSASTEDAETASPAIFSSARIYWLISVTSTPKIQTRLQAS